MGSLSVDQRAAYVSESLDSLVRQGTAGVDQERLLTRLLAMMAGRVNSRCDDVLGWATTAAIFAASAGVVGSRHAHAREGSEFGRHVREHGFSLD